MKRLAPVLLGCGLAFGAATAARADRCADDAAVAAARVAIAAECDCAMAGNHGEYVRCVANAANTLSGAGMLPAECRGRVTSCAARSTCGKPEAVTCCRVDSRGRARCSIKKSADKCRAPRGGTASVGGAGSCCDACGGVPTTTTAPSTTSTVVVPTTTTSTQPGSPSPAFLVE